MKITTVISAKIRDDIYQSIRNGKKQFEVRTEPFGSAGVIRYVSASTGKQLGFWQIKESLSVPISDRSTIQKYAAVPREIVDELFPMTSGTCVYVARLGHEVTVNSLFERGENE
ncbi:hypothetical protein ACFQY8_07635 [Alloscardovia venturai]|uniref:Transcriptional regulator n=1 Tax=Alloscardovia venturai TaxID=1769421 RepID=A0ABW2Y773_9BIFI